MKWAFATKLAFAKRTFMEGLQITAPGTFSTIEKKEFFDETSCVKVKVTRTLFLQEDFNTFNGDKKVSYPIIPSRVAIGKIVETPDENTYNRGDNVFIHSVNACMQCNNCKNDDLKHCSEFLIAGKNCDGFLRDFVNLSPENFSLLPQKVVDKALFIDHIAICDRIIDSISLQKGEHVVIVGADVMGIILAQLVIYYQGVPILVDSNASNLDLAKDVGIYYTVFADNMVENAVSELTGGRLASKVVYMTGSNLNTDIALKLAGHNASVCFAGFDTPNIRVNFNTALLRQLKFNCVTNSYGSFDSAINLLALDAVNVDCFDIKSVKSELAVSTITEMAKSITTDACQNMLIVEMDKF